MSALTSAGLCEAGNGCGCMLALEDVWLVCRLEEIMYLLALLLCLSLYAFLGLSSSFLHLFAVVT